MQPKDYHGIVDDCDMAENGLVKLRAGLIAAKVPWMLHEVDMALVMLSRVRTDMYHRIGVLTSDMPK